jgi:exopolysaccharide biosynthesis polyprenyl glycosylphosphotransferase
MFWSKDIRTHRLPLLGLLELLDIVTFLTCLVWSTVAMLGVDRLPTVSKVHLVWLIGCSIIWRQCLVAAQVYRSRRFSGGFPVREVFVGTAVGLLCVATLSVLLDVAIINLNLLVVVWLETVLLTLVFRVLIKILLVNFRRHGRNLRFAVVVGSGKRARELITKLEDPHTGYRVLGYVDESKVTSTGDVANISYLGPVEALPSIIAANVVDEVFVVLPVRSQYDATARVISHCEDQGVVCHLPCDIIVPEFGTQEFGIFANTPIVTLVRSRVPLWYQGVKRLLDIGISSVLLTALSPLFCLAAIAIKIDSRGPVFFVQQRVGKNKRLFSLLKFRTMTVGSEAAQKDIEHLNEAQGPVFKIRNDPRVTPLGRWLRKTSIDELPQLVNVLFGQMSLVGPRPLPQRDVGGFTSDWQRRRFSVRPGITCLWQVSGRSHLSFNQWMELDMQYIDDRNLWLDLKILAKTFSVVLLQTGAY